MRIVASSYFTDSQGTVSVDGQPLERPFVVLAIGDSQTLASALNIPGGIVDTVRRVGATAQVEQLATVRVDALHTLSRRSTPSRSESQRPAPRPSRVDPSSLPAVRPTHPDRPRHANARGAR